MYPDIIALAIPLLVLSVVLEAMHDRKQKNRQYSLNRSISNISCGIAEQITGFLSKGFFLLCYAAVYEGWRVHTFQDASVLTWVALVLVVDLVFYFFHRACHRHGILWSGHVVHHEVEEYNLTVALRRSVLQELFIIPVYLPLAVLGFSPGAFFLIFAAHNLYQFWIHTPYAPEMRTFGYVFNTAHHHVVHHCRNACYIDKNFAGIFIVWDKFFGTFEPLEESPRFGVHQLTTTLNPVSAQFYTFRRVVQRAMTRTGVWGKVAGLFESPVWMAEEADRVHALREQPQQPAIYNPPFGTSAKRIAFGLFLAALGGVSVYRLIEQELPQAARFLVLFGLGAVVYGIGVLLDGAGSGSHHDAADSDALRVP